MENMTQYQRDFIRMLDSMREEHKGEATCLGVEAKECEKCPLTKFCENDICFNAEKIIEIVTEWAKEHPFVTVRDKFKGAFGVEPKNECGTLICPHFVGFVDVECVYGVGYKDCKKCKEKFWNSEYREPKKEGE